MTNRGQRATGWMAILATALLMQGCAEKPAGPGPRIFNADQIGGAKTCVVPQVTPASGQETRVELKIGNDGGWCGITVSNGGKPYAAGLLATGPAHGKVLIHTVGNDTRIDYTPARAFHGADAFVVKLIPGDATIRVSVAAGPP
jgi:hypothetical protein